MLHLTAILEDHTLIATYDYHNNTWLVTISGTVSGSQKTESLESDELASLMCLALQNEQGIIPNSVIERLYPIAEKANSKFKEDANNFHRLRVIP